MSVITPYRVVSEDLDLKNDVKEGLADLLDSLNVTVPQLVQAASATPEENYVNVTLQTDATVEDSFPLTFKHGLTSRPRLVLLANIDTDESTAFGRIDPWVLNGWTLTDNGLVSVTWITNLVAPAKYDLTFYVRG